MTIPSTRRDFLKLSALGLAATAAADLVPSLQPSAAAADTPGDIAVWVTNPQVQCAQAAGIAWRQAVAPSPAGAITLYPEKTFQEILGFGGAFTDGACYMLNQLPAAAREQLLHEMFHPSRMGLNVCRVCMGSSDYSTSVYSYDDGPADPELKRFSIAHDREYILPVLRQARQENPELFLFGTPWSPPGWMKSGGSMLGGSMRRRYLAIYAQYFVKFLQEYAKEGVPVQCVTPQNEVDTDQDGRMPACIFPQEYEMEFVKFLGPLLRKNQMATKIWILDHNYNLWGRAVCELDDPEMRQYANAVAWHGYVGKPELMSQAHALHPDAGMHWTEGGPDYTNPDYHTDWSKWGKVFTAVLRNWCRSITAWNLALDEKGRPNLGPFPCGGVVSIDSQSKAIEYSGQYWALAQFSRFIRRGARRFDSQSAAGGVEHVAVVNPDGSRAVVITNPGAERTVSLRLNWLQADVNLKPDSLTTLVWA